MGVPPGHQYSDDDDDDDDDDAALIRAWLIQSHQSRKPSSSEVNFRAIPDNVQAALVLAGAAPVRPRPCREPLSAGSCSCAGCRRRAQCTAGKILWHVGLAVSVQRATVYVGTTCVWFGDQKDQRCNAPASGPQFLRWRPVQAASGEAADRVIASG